MHVDYEMQFTFDGLRQFYRCNCGLGCEATDAFLSLEYHNEFTKIAVVMGLSSFT
jgi:hypothetical protein